MTESEKPGPVDNATKDAGIAARDARQKETTNPEAKDDKVTEQVTENVETEEEDDSGADETQNNDTEDSAASDKDEQPKPRKGVGKRIDELTKEKHDARRAAEDAARERDYWREQAQKAMQQPEKAPTQEAPKDDGEPTLEACDFDVAEFNRRHYQWMRERERKQESEQQRQKSFQEKVTAFSAEHPDYAAVAGNPALPITQAMAEVIYDTDNPPAIAYYLGQNPQEAAAIAQMSPNQVGRAIGRIEARLEAPTATGAPRQPEPKTVSRAPDPVTTLSGSPTVKKSYNDMSMREYDAARRKERAAKGLPNT